MRECRSSHGVTGRARRDRNAYARLLADVFSSRGGGCPGCPQERGCDRGLPGRIVGGVGEHCGIGNPADVVDAITGDLAGALACSGLRVLADGLLLESTAAIERLGRRVDASRVAAAAEIGERSRTVLGTGGLACRMGCRTPVELLRRVTLVSGVTADRRLRLGCQTRPRVSLARQGRVPGPVPVGGRSTVCRRVGGGCGVLDREEHSAGPGPCRARAH